MVGYNPLKPGRPSHAYHSFMVGGVRLILDVAVEPGNRHSSKHSEPHLWDRLDRLPAECRPTLVRGDKDWGNQRNMRRCEQEGVHYLFKPAGSALVCNGWTLFGRLAGPDHHREALTSRPLLAAWYRPPDPPCRPDPPDHHRQPRPPSPRGPGASPNCHVLRRPAPNCGAVDRRRTLAPHPQPSTRQVSPRPTTAAAPLATGRMRG